MKDVLDSSSEPRFKNTHFFIRKELSDEPKKEYLLGIHPVLGDIFKRMCKFRAGNQEGPIDFPNPTLFLSLAIGVSFATFL
jgi:hypothetical protein